MDELPEFFTYPPSAKPLKSKLPDNFQSWFLRLIAEGNPYLNQDLGTSKGESFYDPSCMRVAAQFDPGIGPGPGSFRSAIQRWPRTNSPTGHSDASASQHTGFDYRSRRHQGSAFATERNFHQVGAAGRWRLSADR